MPSLNIDDIGLFCAAFVVVAFSAEIIYNMWNRKE